MSKSSPDRINPRSPAMGLLILSLIFRLLLLVVASGFSWVLGMAIAVQYPSTSEEIPIAEKLLRGAKGIVSKKQLPQSSSATPESTPETLKLQVELTEAQRQELQTELKELQTQLNTLIGQTTTLENQLGVSRSNQNLEARLNLISQQLAIPLSTNERKQISQFTKPVFSGNQMMVTLPRDVLFESGSNTIRSEGKIILDNLIGELKNYKGATISISGHTDSRGKVKANRELSFLQAEAVAEYLSKNLGQRYRLLAIGYGESRPIAENDSQTNRQRNRRIEVKINPRNLK
ncbi:OmpA family protein [Dapis sp. BLCC M126]|uniref:OmpA family protein n=1 Tax=Dapis sp. BLCC M126 TaxID=3400189 RepID=UPI003CE8CE25